MRAALHTVTAVEFDRARDLAVRIFNPAYDDLSPARRLMLNIDMQAALMVALYAMAIDVEDECCDESDCPSRTVPPIRDADVHVRRVAGIPDGPDHLSGRR